MEKEISIKDVRLAEQYLAVLQQIKELEGQVSIDEDTVHDAKTYLDTLREIEAIEPSWDEDDVTEASTYLKTLQKIEDNKR